MLTAKQLIIKQTEKICCEYCDCELDLHQPDMMCPRRLLGTCEMCHAWFVIDIINEERTITEIPLAQH